MLEKNQYDILIVGGGMVGASLACALGGQALRIGVIEAHPFGSAAQPSFDDRSIALAYGSRRIYEGIGLWGELAAQVSPIHKIHISNRGHFGFTRMDRHDYGVDALGYVVENRIVGAVVMNMLQHFDNIELLAPAELVNLAPGDPEITITLKIEDKERQLTSRLLIGADGNQSMVRTLLNIDCETRDYAQTAIVTNVTTEKSHHNVAYERFTEQGPLAFLPLNKDRCSVVWTVSPDNVDDNLAMTDADFSEQLQRYFGFRLGRIQRVGKRIAYPLRFMRATQCIAPRVALIGNAAHALHPVAGQGFNLGIRDVAALAQVVCDAHAQQQDLGSLDVLREYEAWRKRDQNQIMFFTDTLARLFANPFAPLAVARNMGLVLTDIIPRVKGTFAKHTMGLAGKLPRLARGLTL